MLATEVPPDCIMRTGMCAILSRLTGGVYASPGSRAKFVLTRSVCRIRKET